MEFNNCIRWCICNQKVQHKSNSFFLVYSTLEFETHFFHNENRYSTYNYVYSLYP